jgi:hypothetical protein
MTTAPRLAIARWGIADGLHRSSRAHSGVGADADTVHLRRDAVTTALHGTLAFIPPAP